MRKVLAFPLVALALLGPAGWATAALDDVKGPACADITDSSWAYSEGGDTASVDLFVASASCPSVTYTLYAQNSVTGTDATTIVGSGTLSGDGDALFEDGTDFVGLTASIPAEYQDGEVCLYVTTSVGRHVFDRAPDANLSTNCVSLVPGGRYGGSGFS